MNNIDSENLDCMEKQKDDSDNASNVLIIKNLVGDILICFFLLSKIRIYLEV